MTRCLLLPVRGCFAPAFVLCVLCGTGLATDNPDTILINGDVIALTGPDNGDYAEAVAISGERIFAVGTSEAIGKLAGPQTEVIDLEGSAVLPGFIDAHGHFPGSGLIARHFVDLNSPPIGTVRTIDDMVARLAARAAETPKGEWIQARGYDDTLVAEMRHPTRWDLDRASTDHPIFIGHISGHLAVANSLALEMADVTRATPQPLGGKIRIDGASGEPNGVLEEPPAMGQVSRLLPQFSEDELVDAIAHAAMEYAAIDDILYAFERAFEAAPRNDARHIVIHAQMARDDQLDRMSAMGLIPSFFNLHTYFWGDRHWDMFMGPARASRMSPAASAVKRGLIFTLHADTPVVPMEPMRIVWSAVNRISSGGRVIGEAQRISVLEALKGITVHAAYQSFEENEKGTVEAGKLADLVVLDRNPLEVPPLDLDDISVLRTIVGGRTVFERQTLASRY